MWCREHDDLWYGPCATLAAAMLARRDEIAIDAQRSQAARRRKSIIFPAYLWSLVLSLALLVWPIAGMVPLWSSLVSISLIWAGTAAWEVAIYATIGNRFAK
jgi:hypothetical protein